MKFLIHPTPHLSKKKQKTKTKTKTKKKKEKRRKNKKNYKFIQITELSSQYETCKYCVKKVKCEIFRRTLKKHLMQAFTYPTTENEK